LTRALRIDKLTLVALEATLRLYCEPALAARRIPTLRMICAGEAEILPRARKLANLLKKRLSPFAPSISIRQGKSCIGGGAFPGHDLPTWLVCLTLQCRTPDELRTALLQTDPPVVVKIEEDEVRLDPRTLDDSEFTMLAEAFGQALNTCT